MRPRESCSSSLSLFSRSHCLHHTLSSSLSDSLSLALFLTLNICLPLPLPLPLLQFSALYVRRFMSAVKCIQRNIRAFLVCKSARISAVQKIWNVVEFQFIKVNMMSLCPCDAEDNSKRSLLNRWIL